jgi:hypothetical protein
MDVRTIVIMLFVLLMYRSICGVVRLGGASQYPRHVTWQRDDDAIFLVIRLAFAAVCGWMLWA